MDFKLLKARAIFYPTLAWNVLLGRWLKIRNWWDEIDSTIVLGALPFRRDVPPLADLGITAVVNTCLEYAGPLNAYQEHGIEQFHMPTQDYTHPRLEDLQRAVDFIEQCRAKGGRVYVHCKAGRARSATVAVCWLIRSQGLDRYQAQAQILQKRPHANPRIADRPVVVEFERAEQQSQQPDQD